MSSLEKNIPSAERTSVDRRPGSGSDLGGIYSPPYKIFLVNCPIAVFGSLVEDLSGIFLVSSCFLS